MPYTAEVTFEGDLGPSDGWLLGEPVAVVHEKDFKALRARSLRNFQLYLDARLETMRERWRLEDEIAVLKSKIAELED